MDMTRPRGSVLVAVVAALSVTQILFEELIVFLDTTEAIAPNTLESPHLMVGLPFVLFLLLAGVVWAWALVGEYPRV